jgi:hypothetical protein
MSKTSYDPFNVFQAAADPSFPTPKSGDVYRNTATGALRIYLSGAWTDLPYPITVSSTAPSSPAQGAVWVDTSSPGLDPTVTQLAARNTLHNGAMRVCQRGTTGSGSTNATTALSGLDRWMTFRTTFAAGLTWTQTSASLPTGFTNGMRIQRIAANAATNPCWATQTYENESSSKFQGKYITVSFWAKAGANYSNASSAMSCALVSGQGTEVSAVTTTGPAFVTTSTVEMNNAVTLTTSWQRFVMTTAAALSTSVTQIALSFGFTPVGTAGVDDWFEVTGVQLEEGQTVTPFENAIYALELQTCKRYYWRIINDVAAQKWLGAGQVTSATGGAVAIPFSTTMRAKPTMAVSSSTAFLVTNATGSGTATTAMTLSASSHDQLAMVTGTVASGLVAGNACLITTTSTLGVWIDFSAEI